MTHRTSSPIGSTARRLFALSPYAGFDVGGAGGDGWVSLAQVGADDHIDRWFARLLSRHGHPGVTGSLLGGALGRAVVAPTVSAIVVDARCPDPSAHNLMVRLGPDGAVHGYAVRGPIAAVLPDDAAATDARSAVVADEAGLLAWWARRAAATLTPLLAAIRARAPFGLRGLWGGVADEVTGVALWIGQLARHDPASLWSLGQRMVEALAGHAPVSLPRARPLPGQAGGGQWSQVRATCCLYYRSSAVAGVADGYCGTCPLIKPLRARAYQTTTHPLSIVD